MAGDTIIAVPAPNATLPDLGSFSNSSSSETDPLLMPSNEEDSDRELWNEPRVNAYRYLSTLYVFTTMGMNDAAYGLEEYYDINYTTISLVFLAPFIGYTVAAIINTRLHMRFGQIGVVTIAPVAKLIVFGVTSVKPPFAVLPLVFILSGFANGIEDGCFNAWVGNMKHANELVGSLLFDFLFLLRHLKGSRCVEVFKAAAEESLIWARLTTEFLPNCHFEESTFLAQLLGFLHGAYGLGATISPLLATAMVTKWAQPWWAFYYIMTALSLIELIICILSFRKATGAVYRASHTPSDPSNTKEPRGATKEAVLNPITWICSFFLLCYVGVEVSLGGWLVTFMLKVRHGSPFSSGIVVTGFWLGLTLGRVTLGFITGRVGEKLAITTYLLLSIACELCFWLIPSFLSSAIFAGFLGFFLGPLFPAVIVVATKILPRRLHISTIGFASAFGGGGAAIFPFAVGALAQARGVWVLQPFALGLLVVILGLWCALPGGFRRDGLEKARLRKGEEGEGSVISA
ncbi:hypothetical protein HYALB_00009862 [Hymenoscyphus albidus]|uniref:Major facilitator superfamily (MFS) profile domain-containing protein n=1 Tax=Hymenoscyphus albidus TaxID=595503 RepID=A0A9N9Q2H2_9HELO|nr:hypothetical protein HYALB_00009862 [Hymenoscyphus albidus]